VTFDFVQSHLCDAAAARCSPLPTGTPASLKVHFLHARGLFCASAGKTMTASDLIIAASNFISAPIVALD
jgi:hypothetical protein